MESPSVTTCPACHKAIPMKAIPKHVSGCQVWATAIGIPPSEYNWDAYHKRGPYADGQVEGVDYVVCRVCAPRDLRFKRMMDHLKKVHGLTEDAYVALHPGAAVRVAGTAAKRVETVKARYGVENVFQTDEVKAKTRDTMLANYGAPTVLQSPELRERVAETNLARYGHANPFGSPEVQEKIRQTHLATYGVENPNQAPEVVAKRIETNRAKYGANHYFETEAFREKFVAASRERFDADHPMQSEDGKQLCFDAIQDRYGVDSVFQLPEVQQRLYETNLANHGGKHSQQCPEVLAKARETWLEKYGTDNPSKVEAVKVRIKDVWMGKYGVPFPPQSLWTNREQSFPNGLEQGVIAVAPEYVVYAGDGSYWVRHPGASRARNPDFVVLNPDQLEAYRGGAPLNVLRTGAVIEAFGTYWHGPAKTGKSREAHEADVVAYYAKAGIKCLVLWEELVRRDPATTTSKIQRFLVGVRGA